ncbi:MAG: hypothetical protein ICV83_28495 [Cytophagales bacterium]|nr:hypothetical protein [Cytophagales bacterium]
MNDTENKQEGAPLQHAAEANREREQEQAITPEGAGTEGNGSVFGNEPRIVSHSTGLPLDQAAAASQEDGGQTRAPQDYGKDSGDAHQHGAEGTNPSGDLVNNTGADPSGSGADAASG